MLPAPVRPVRRGPSRGRPRPPRLEILEDRLAPAVLRVGAGEPYHTITSALAAANPGDTVRVDPGVYREAVNIAKNNIPLEGVNLDAVIQAPASLAGNDFPLVEVNGAAGVTIRHLTVAGPYTGGFTTVNGRQLGLRAGIFVAHGGSASIAENRVTDIRDDPPKTTADDGFGIVVGSRSDVLSTTGSALVEHNAIDNYQRAGTDVANVGSGASFLGNTVTGLGLTLGNQYAIQVGMAVEAGAAALLQGNTVTRNVQTTAGGLPVGIFFSGDATNVRVVGNQVTGNTTGIEALSARGGPSRPTRSPATPPTASTW